jgi:hypothetical protein
MLPLYLRQHCCILSTLKMFLEKVDVPKGTAFNHITLEIENQN